jgi:MFS family permease
VWPLYAGTLINRFGGFVVFFLVLYLRARGYSTSAAGGALSAYGVGSLVAAAAGGLLADRVGRRNAIALSMFGSAVAMLALWRASSLAAVIALASVAGLFAELYRPAAGALLTDLLAPEQRVVGFAVYRFAINLGTAIGPAVGGLVARHGFGPLFVGDAATSLACGAITLAWLPHGVRTSRRDERRGEASRAILRDRAFLVFCASTLLGALVYMQAEATLPLAVVDGGHSRAFYGLLMSFNGLLVIAIELPLVTVTQRFAPRWPMVLGSLLVGLGFALTGVSGAAVALAVSVVVWTAGEMVFSPVASAYVAALAPPTLRGRYTATWGLMFALGAVLGPAAGTALYAWHPRALWLACLVVGVVSALLLVRARARPVELEPLPA